MRGRMFWRVRDIVIEVIMPWRVVDEGHHAVPLMPVQRDLGVSIVDYRIHPMCPFDEVRWNQHFFDAIHFSISRTLR